MADTNRTRRLVYVKAADLELWRCRPFETIDVLDLRDRPVGHVDGLVFDAHADQPLFLVIRRGGGNRLKWFLVPVSDAWFDETERAIRIDARLGSDEAPPFNPDEFARMSPEEAAEYEKRVLGHCCPEIGLHRDGTPAYERHAAFQCPTWLRPASPERAAHDMNP